MSPLFSSGSDFRDISMFSKKTQEEIGIGGTIPSPNQ